MIGRVVNDGRRVASFQGKIALPAGIVDLAPGEIISLPGEDNLARGSSRQLEAEGFLFQESLLQFGIEPSLDRLRLANGSRFGIAPGESSAEGQGNSSGQDSADSDHNQQLNEAETATKGGKRLSRFHPVKDFVQRYFPAKWP